VTATATDASADLSGDSANVTLNLPAGVELVSGDATQQLGSLSTSGQAGDSATTSWVVRATSDGNYTLSAATDAQHCSEHFTSQASTAFAATTPQPPPTGGGQPQPGPTPQPSPIPMPAPVGKLAPHLRVSAPRWRGSRLRVTGSLASRAAGHVLVTYTAKRHGRTVRVRLRAPLHHGRFTALVRVQRSLRHLRATVTVSYGGSSQYKAQRVTRRSPRRA
jgi:hypothetical protein